MPIVIANPAGTTPAFILQDTFTDVNGTQIASHTMNVGPGWSRVGIATASAGAESTYTINNNRLSLAQDSTAIVASAGTADGTIEMEWTPQALADDRNTIIMRYLDTDNFWGFQGRDPNDDLRLYYYTGGVVTFPDTAAFTWIDGQTYTLKVIMSGNSIQCYVDDVFKLSTSSAILNSQTQHGCGRNGGATESIIDNFTMVA